jgi:hypothetical protein
MILQKLHQKIIVWSLQNYILYNDTTQISQYKKWLPIIVCVIVLTRLERITTWLIILYA